MRCGGLSEIRTPLKPDKGVQKVKDLYRQNDHKPMSFHRNFFQLKSFIGERELQSLTPVMSRTSSSRPDGFRCYATLFQKFIKQVLSISFTLILFLLTEHINILHLNMVLVIQHVFQR